jgi:hypothetical protein
MYGSFDPAWGICTCGVGKTQEKKMYDKCSNAQTTATNYNKQSSDAGVQQGYHPDLNRPTVTDGLVDSAAVGGLGGNAGIIGKLSTSGVSPLTDDQKIEKFFTYQSPTPEQLAHLADVREGAKAFAKILLRHVPAGADRTAAIRKLREAVMTANAAIVLNGLNL